MRLTAFVLCLAAASSACSSMSQLGGSSSSKKDSATASPTAGDSQQGATDQEKNHAVPPQSAAGAYLADCGDAGMHGYACVVTDHAGKKVDTAAMGQMAVTVVFDGSIPADHPSLQMGSQQDTWSFTFAIAAAKIGALKQIVVSGTISGGTMTATVTTFKPITQLAQDTNAALVKLLPDSQADLMFLTRQSYRPGSSNRLNAGAFGTAAEADGICKALADASTSPIANGRGSGVLRNWFAIIGDNGMDARTSINRFGRAIGVNVYSTAGALVARAGAWTNAYTEYLSPVVTDENGSYVGADAAVWTGTGAPGNSQSCGGWGSGSAADRGSSGLAGSQSSWLTAASTGCDQSLHLYCIGRTP